MSNRSQKVKREIAISKEGVKIRETKTQPSQRKPMVRLDLSIKARLSDEQLRALNKLL